MHPSGKWILGPKNLAFQHGEDHKMMRKSFLSLFTTKALGMYVTLQVRSRERRRELPRPQRPSPAGAAG